MKNKKRNRFLLLLILLLGITIGYAALATTLKINGSATITKNTWEIYWSNVQVIEGSVNATTNIPSIGQDTNDPVNTKVTWSTTLNLPGDFYEFTVDAVNNGSIDAMITGINPSVTPALEDYIKYTVTYDDGVAIAENHILPKKTGNTATVQKYKVRIEFLDTITPVQMNEIPDGGLSYTFSYEVTYGQATDDAIIKPPFVLGDYFTLVPDAETATTDIAGFSGSTPTADQTLWRVIDIHEDGTVDAVSEYISTNEITITGANGYKNYVAGLQDIASKYAKSGYTTATRMTGYDGQTQIISDTSSFDGSSIEFQSRPYGTFPTTGEGQEYSDGVLGDTLYLKDYQLVSNVYKNESSIYSNTGLKAYKFGGTISVPYWLSSRDYSYVYLGADMAWFSGICISDASTSSTFTSKVLVEKNGNCYDMSTGLSVCWYSRSGSYSVRPIITLKYGVVKSGGSGTKSDPFTFE